MLAKVQQLPFQERAQRAHVIGGGSQYGADFGQRETEHLQRPDPVEPPDVFLGVAAVAGSRPPACRQQPNLVVVMERPDRDATRFGKFADAPLTCGTARLCHVNNGKSSPHVRIKTNLRARGPAAGAGSVPVGQPAFPTSASRLFSRSTSSRTSVAAQARLRLDWVTGVMTPALESRCSAAYTELSATPAMWAAL